MSKFMNKLLLIFMVFVVSAATFEGFFVKWHFQESHVVAERFSFEAMYEGTAYRPFVHRQLLISISKGAVEVLPYETKEILRDKIHDDNFLSYKFRHVDIKDKFLIEYYIVYFLSFACLFASVLVWRRIYIDLTESPLAGTLAPLAFTIIFPYLETNGGFFYDFSELLFFSLATLFVLRGHYLALIFMTPLAEHNKESFFFFLLTLYPILRRTQTLRKTIIIIGVSMLLALLTYLPVVSRFADNGGDIVDNGNLFIVNVIICLVLAYFFGVYLLCKKIYAKSPLLSYVFFAVFVIMMFILRGSDFPWNFFDTFGHTYSVIGGERLFLLHMIFIFWIIKSAWKFLDQSLKNYALLALAINTPLIVLFGLVYELRNWSLTYPAFIILIAFYLKDKLKETELYRRNNHD